jgi:hypothetical protein
LFGTTMLFERIIWLARRNALLILPETPNENGVEADTALAADPKPSSL